MLSRDLARCDPTNKASKPRKCRKIRGRVRAAAGPPPQVVDNTRKNISALLLTLADAEGDRIALGARTVDRSVVGDRPARLGSGVRLGCVRRAVGRPGPQVLADAPDLGDRVLRLLGQAPELAAHHPERAPVIAGLRRDDVAVERQ